MQNEYGERSSGLRAGAAESSSANMYPFSSVGVLPEENILLSDSERLLSRPEWKLACRVAASKRLCKSELLPRFLLYVCEQYILGNVDQITEQRIGTQIFNRDTDYNPGEDNIVRSYARLLRKRLDEYFEGEGRDEPIRIAIPRGGYVPLFTNATEALEPKVPSGAVLDAPEPPVFSAAVAIAQPVGVAAKAEAVDIRPVRSSSASWSWRAPLAGLVVGLLLASGAWLVMRRLQESKEQGPSHAVWAQLFQQNRNTLIVPADSGLGILQNLTGRLAGLEEYANGSYLTDIKPMPGLGIDNLNDLRRQRYTSVVDLKIASMLTRLPEFIPGRSEVRYARSVTAEDLKNSNVILIGSAHTNPWVSLYDKKLNFRLEYTPAVNQSLVINQHPIGAEQKTYVNGTDQTTNRTYGVIDYVPGLDGVGHVLIIQGLNMAATQAAADTLFSAKVMKPILEQATINGQLVPFELLVETSSIGATAPGMQIIATRVYPQ